MAKPVDLSWMLPVSTLDVSGLSTSAPERVVYLTNGDAFPLPNRAHYGIEEFAAWTTCPGCGFGAVHLLGERTGILMVSVERECRACAHQWSQRVSWRTSRESE